MTTLTVCLGYITISKVTSLVGEPLLRIRIPPSDKRRRNVARNWCRRELIALETNHSTPSIRILSNRRIFTSWFSKGKPERKRRYAGSSHQSISATVSSRKHDALQQRRTRPRTIINPRKDVYLENRERTAGLSQPRVWSSLDAGVLIP